MKEKVITLIREIKNGEALKDSFSGNPHIINDFGLSSLDIMRLLLKLEDNFNITIDVDSLNMDVFTSIDHLCNYIQMQN